MGRGHDDDCGVRRFQSTSVTDGDPAQPVDGTFGRGRPCGSLQDTLRGHPTPPGSRLVGAVLNTGESSYDDLPLGAAGDAVRSRGGDAEGEVDDDGPPPLTCESDSGDEDDAQAAAVVKAPSMLPSGVSHAISSEMKSAVEKAIGELECSKRWDLALAVTELVDL